jgi:GT2 family glycosyltransferase
MNKENPVIWAVIPTWNRKVDLLECLESIIDTGYPALKIIVVDNGSTDDTVGEVRTKYPGIHLIELKQNRGAAFASNAGFQYAVQQGADYILRLDSDIVIDRELISEFVNAAALKKDFGILFAKILRYDQPDRIWYTGAQSHPFLLVGRVENLNSIEDSSDRTIQEKDYVPSAVMFLTRAAVLETGGFDESFFVYSEDFDLCIRVRETGKRIYYVPGARARHKIGSEKLSAWGAEQFYRGRMLFYRKHSHGLHRIALIGFIFLYALYKGFVSGQIKLIGPSMTGLLNGLKFNLKTHGTSMHE